jgi:hypothetical protein
VFIHPSIHPSIIVTLLPRHSSSSASPSVFYLIFQELGSAFMILQITPNGQRVQLYQSPFTGMVPEQTGTVRNGVFAGVNNPKLKPNEAQI